MAVKYYFTVKIYYKGVCIWTERVSKTSKYLILRLVRDMRRIDNRWDVGVEVDN